MRVLLIAILLAAPLGAATYVDEPCAFRFDVPEGWRVVQRQPYDEPCSVRVRASDWLERMAEYDVDTGTIFVRVGRTPFRGLWLDDEPVENFRVRGWRGKRGWTTVSAARRSGGCNGAGLARTVSQCAPNGLCLVVQGGPRSTVDAIAGSFRFTGPFAWTWQKSYRQADAELNAVYREVMNALPPAARTKLRDEERAWIRMRDVRCQDYIDCLERETLARIGELDPFRQ